MIIIMDKFYADVDVFNAEKFFNLDKTKSLAK